MKSLISNIVNTERELQYYIIPASNFTVEEATAFVNQLSGGNMSMCLINSNEMINTDTTCGNNNGVEISPENFLELSRREDSNEDKLKQTITEDAIEMVKEENSENVDDPLPTSNATSSSKNLICVFCNDTFRNSIKYKEHMQHHYKNSKVYKCETCLSSFNVEVNYKIHLAYHLKPGDKLVCFICSRNFHRVASLRSHLNMHSEDESFTCILCLQEFISQDDFSKHIEWHRHDMFDDRRIKTESVLICPDCEYVFDNQDDYKAHIAKHNELKKMIYKGRKTKKRNTNSGKTYRHKCHTCDKSFIKPSLLTRHLRIHTGDRPFKCNLCHLAFGQKVTLNIHLLKHTGIKPYVCSLCNANFSQKGNLRAHLEKTHTISVTKGEKAYRCTQCTCIFKRVASLNGHITKVHSEKVPINDPGVTITEFLKDVSELAQDTCNMTDLNSISNEVHSNKAVNIISNLSLRPQSLETVFNVKLTDSSMGFQSRKQYEIKVRTVGDFKYYCCKYCRKEFKKPSDLIRHVRVHTGEKPFKCDRCGMCFSLRSTLRQHASTHFGNRNCECFICHKRFTSGRTLKLHIRRHAQDTGNKHRDYFKCNICSKIFSSTEKVKRHLKTHENCDESTKIDLKEPLVQTENGLVPISTVKNRPLSIPKLPIPSVGVRQQKLPIVPSAYPEVTSDGIKIRKYVGGLNNNREVESDNAISILYNDTKYTIMADKSLHRKRARKIVVRPKIVIDPHEIVNENEQVGMECIQKSLNNDPKEMKRLRIKRFTCDFCGKTCASMYHLREHINFHTQTKNYHCHLCERRFVTASILRRHLISHSDERPYFCPYCKRAFKILRLCKNHIETHRAEIMLRTREDADNSLIAKLDLTDTLINSPFKLTEISDIDFHNTGDYLSSTLPPVHTINASDKKFNNKILFPMKEFIEIDTKIIDVQTKNKVSEAGIQENVQKELLEMNDPIILEKEASTDDRTMYLISKKNNKTNDQIILQNVHQNIISSEHEIVLEYDKHLDEYCVSTKKIQILDETGVENSSLVNIKLQGSDPLLINSVNEPEQNILYPIYPNTSAQDIQQFETYNPNLIFNGTVPMHDINIADDSDKIESTGTTLTLPNIGEVSASTNPSLEHDIFVKVIPDDVTRNLTIPSIDRNNYSKDDEVYKGAEFVCHSCKSVFIGLETLQNHNCSPKSNRNSDDGRNSTNVIEETSNINIPASSKARPIYTCIYCRQKFESKRELTKHKDKEGHRKIKDNKSKHSCEVCCKLFGKSSDLLRHSRIHSGEKPFQCPECSKSFTLKSTLGTHMRTHDNSTSKSFICQVCNKTVSCQSSLNLHMLLHTGEKPQACPTCGERFRTVSKKRLHIQNVHLNPQNNKNKKALNLLESLVMQTNEDILKEQVENVAICGKQVHLNLTPTSAETNEPVENTSFLPLNTLVDELNILPNHTETIPIDPDLLHDLQVNGILTKDGELSSLYRIEYEYDRATNGKILNITPIQQEIPDHNQFIDVQTEENQIVDIQQEREYLLQSSIGQATDISIIEDALEYQGADDEEDVLRSFMPMIEIIAREDQDVFLNKATIGGSLKRKQLQYFNEKFQEYKSSNVISKDKNDSIVIGNDRALKHKKTRRKIDKEVLKKAITLSTVIEDEGQIIQDVIEQSNVELVQLEEEEEESVENPIHIGNSRSADLINCPECRRKFKTRNGLNKHKRTHGRGDHACVSCPRRFRNEQLLLEHKRLAHEGHRPLACPYCDNTFQRESNRKVHMKRLHSGLMDQADALISNI